MKKTRDKIFFDRGAVGGRLKAWRTHFNWTRKEVAERCGLTEKYYSDIERGSCGMSVETLISLSELYGFSMDYLIRGEKEEETNPDMKDIFLSNLDKLPPEKQNCCLQNRLQDLADLTPEAFFVKM